MERLEAGDGWPQHGTLSVKWPMRVLVAFGRSRPRTKQGFPSSVTDRFKGERQVVLLWFMMVHGTFPEHLVNQQKHLTDRQTGHDSKR